MYGRTFRPWLRRLMALLLLSGLLAGTAAAEESGFSLSLPQEVKGYTHCEITVQAPAAGEMLLTLYDSLDNPWLYRQESLSDGETVLSWDGRGAGGELLMSGPYRMVAEFFAADGRDFTASASFSVRGYASALALALPSSETLYLDGGENWFVECWVPANCIVAMDILDRAGNKVYTKSVTMKDPDRDILRWNGTGSDYQKVAPGEYTVHLYPKKNPDFDYTFPLTVEETAPEKTPVAVTGPVIPERDMSDEEVWEIMMKPSVVINDNGTFRRFNLYGVPKTGTRPIGTLRCALQGLEILETEGAWAHVRAARHEDGQMMEGYYLLKSLTVYEPNPHYGVLIDKKEQTLTVFEDGKRIGTVPVSTGLVTPGNTYRETPAGAFLTDVHTGASFAQEGYRYEYPLRYDGGNYIHGAGYVRNGRSRDYSTNQQQLGKKASHGCTRVSLFLREDSPINMYWLWIHLPYHTRIIVLDD